LLREKAENDMRESLTFVIGGCRSGKSRFALETALRTPAERRLFVATAVAFDAEMRTRVERHRQERGPGWITVEAPADLPEAIERHGGAEEDLLLVDSLTMWVGNRLLQEPDPARVEAEIPRLVRALAAARAPVVAVADEVGLGIVPDNALARAFRDLAGTLNQAVAARADRVVLVAAGLPLTLKPAPEAGR
jgi:adenosylcobinamide kinase / adenosylcobinamide-phosphate guanylyltransferase